MAKNGGTLEWVASVPGDLPDFLAKYDAVFLSRTPVDNAALLDYVNGGGCVYIGAGASAGEPSIWNTFLSHFGIVLNDGSSQTTDILKLEPSVHPLMQGVAALYFDKPSNIGLTKGADPSRIVGAWTPSDQPMIIAADAGMKTQTWTDGVIEVTHHYRNAIQKNYIISGESVTIKNVTTTLDLTDVKLSLDVVIANDDSDWAAWTCDAGGNGKRYRNILLSNTLAPGQSVSEAYFYTTTPTGDYVAGPLSVDIHVMPEYMIKYDKDKSVGAIPVQASATAASDDKPQIYGEPIVDVDKTVQITDFSYVPTLAETSDTRMISGSFTVTALFGAKQMSISVGVEPTADDAYWDASSCDPSGNDAHPPPWYPPSSNLTMTEKSTTFPYQYNLEANIDPLVKEGFTINLHILPKIVVNYLGEYAFTSSVQAND
ncbi:hypothetical protein WME97_08060 [Sorangium sp. So ce367]|uniref:hypothetical protein n=1 Tax=Sorangium sp. So ce367 TaxID=3133305 RepID=UPI003F5F8ED8